MPTHTNQPAGEEADLGVWIDTDLGFDDLVAILVVRQAGLVTDGVSLVFGNAPLWQVKRNAAGAVMAFGWSMPVHVGRDRPVLGRVETAQRVLGSTGIPTIGRSLPVAELRTADGSAFNALCAWLEQDGEHRILAMGPLTNIAALALARPDLACRIDSIVWMGGSVTRGNHTPFAEFNAYADPEALAIVLAHGMPLCMVDLDICRRVMVRSSDVAPIRDAGGRNAALLADMLDGYVAIGTSRGREGHFLYDPVAAALFVRPEIAEVRRATIGVTLGSSPERGRTVVSTEPSGTPNASYLANIDAEAVRATILGALAAAAG